MYNIPFIRRVFFSSFRFRSCVEEKKKKRKDSMTSLLRAKCTYVRVYNIITNLHFRLLVHANMRWSGIKHKSSFLWVQLEMVAFRFLENRVHCERNFRTLLGNIVLVPRSVAQIPSSQRFRVKWARVFCAPTRNLDARGGKKDILERKNVEMGSKDAKFGKW